MKRADALNYMRFAGYHGDRKAFTRLLIENRVSQGAAQEAFAAGEKARAAGVRCNCADCK